jgi:RHS repeat-associated protein
MKIQFIAFALLSLPLAASTQPRVGTNAQEIQWSSGPYRYDGTGNILRIGPNHLQTTDVYRYDAASRLVHATADTPQHRNTQTFAYDTFGNLRRIDTTTLRDGAAPDTLATIIGIDPQTNRTTPAPCLGINDGSCLFGTYDEAGHQNWSSAGVQYEYDAAGMMTRLRSTTRTEEYVYDANNERIATVGALETRVTLRNLDAKVSRELAIRNDAVQWKKDYVYRDGTLLAAILPDTRHHFHLDHLGTPRLITDDRGMKVSTHTYWPYGAEAPASEPDSERMKFTGHERDFGAGPGEDLDYMHARFYNPMGGRFLAIDPSRESADRALPQTWNRYTYAENNPINKTDPDGKNPVAMLLSGAISVGYESVRQIRSGEPVNNKRLFAALGAGFVSGAIGPIGGNGMRAVLTGGAVSNVVAGTVQRVAAGEKTTGTDVVIEAASGAAGRAVGRVVGNAMVSTSNTSGKLNELTWKGAVQRAEASAANAGLGADSETARQAATVTEGLVRTGGAIGNIVGKEIKAEFQREVDK